MTDKKGIVGRPTDYDKKYCQEIIEWFDREPFEPVMVFDKDLQQEVPFITRNGMPAMKPNKLPTIENFARHINVATATIHNWCKAHPEFLGAVNEAKAISRDILVQNGLAKLYDPTIVKFVGVNYFTEDLKDKQEVENTGTVTNNNINTEITKEDKEEFSKIILKGINNGQNKDNTNK